DNAVREKEVDVISGYSTDGRVKAYDLKLLKDDKHVFPPYYAAPLVRQDVLEKYPELESVLNKLAGKISDSLMTEMNYEVDNKHYSPESVAKKFLQHEGLYQLPQNKKEGTIRIGSKIFSEQYILAAMYKMLIEGYLGLKVSTKKGLGGTKICFDALMTDEIDLYPEYTGTALQVILDVPSSKVDDIIDDKEAVFHFVQKEFGELYRLKWLKPLGFNNSYALMMRRKQAEKLGINTISDLKNFLQE